MATPEMSCAKFFLGIIGVFEIIIFIIFFHYFNNHSISLFFLVCGLLNEISACFVADVKTHIRVRIAYIVMQTSWIILNLSIDLFEISKYTAFIFLVYLLVVLFLGVAISIYVIHKCKRH